MGHFMLSLEFCRQQRINSHRGGKVLAVHTHNPQLVKAQAGAFQQAENLQRCIGCFGVEYRLLGQLLQVLQGSGQTYFNGQVVQGAELLQQSVPELPLLVFHAVKGALAGPAHILEKLVKKSCPGGEVFPGAGLYPEEGF